MQYYTVEGKNALGRRHSWKNGPVSTMSNAVPETSSRATIDLGRAVTKSLLGWGVDALITDRPDLMVPLVRGIRP